MSDRRYVNLRVTPQKWEDNYFGDFEAPIALFPAPSRPTPSPTRTPTPTPSISSTPSVTPSITPTNTTTPTVTPSSSSLPITPSVTPSVTPTISVSPTQTITPTASITPTITPTGSVTPTPTYTPTTTPTPSPSPVPQYNILTEDSDEILTEGADELITQAGPSNADDIDMSFFEQGIKIVVVDGETSTTLISAQVTEDDYTSGATFNGPVNLEFTWTKYVSTDELYRINVYEDEGGSAGRLLAQSTKQSSGSYNYTGDTDVFVTASVHTSNDSVLNKTTSAGSFTWAGRTYSVNPGSTQWGIDGSTPWGSNQYDTTSNGTNKLVIVRTSLSAWTRYTYTFSTGIWSNPQTISTGVSNYGASDQVTLVDNLP